MVELAALLGGMARRQMAGVVWEGPFLGGFSLDWRWEEREKEKSRDSRDENQLLFGIICCAYLPSRLLHLG